MDSFLTLGATRLEGGHLNVPSKTLSSPKKDSADKSGEAGERRLGRTWREELMPDVFGFAAYMSQCHVAARVSKGPLEDLRDPHATMLA